MSFEVLRFGDHGATTSTSGAYFNSFVVASSRRLCSVRLSLQRLSVTEAVNRSV